MMLVVGPDPVLAGGLLWLDDHWDEFADQDKVMSTEDAPHAEAV
jgi:hypothetical protein